MNRIIIAGAMLILLVTAACSKDKPTGVDDGHRLNILLIVADDLGYSDLGSFGGEIQTPNLDQLAYDGVRFTSFYTAAACSPTRAMLLTGADHHMVGLGSMNEFLTPEQRKQPGYEGRLNNRVTTFVKDLQAAGYATYMAGKWHLGSHPESLPNQQGFTRSFALMEGAANHFDQRGVTSAHPVADYREDGERVELAEDFYSSITYTDKMIEYLDLGKERDGPFFAYLGYTAPHWPLQAPADSIARIEGRYDQGYDTLRRSRRENMARLGIIAEHLVDSTFSIRPETEYVPWKSLTSIERKRSSRLMEIYAAMVEVMDAQIGRVIDHLRQHGELDNTVIVFMSDNGAEGLDKGGRPAFRDWVDTFSKDFDALGTKDTFAFYGPGWATAGTAPYRVFKGYSAEGGIRTPAFIWSKGLRRRQVISDQLVTVRDIGPTLLNLAGIESRDPGDRGQRGQSLVPYLNGEAASIHADDEAIGWELFGRAAIRKGDWKLVRMPQPYGSGAWQLFNVVRDPTELEDTAEDYPEVFSDLLAEWMSYVEANGVDLEYINWPD